LCWFLGGHEIGHRDHRQREEVKREENENQEEKHKKLTDYPPPRRERG
jgi:hypothetical protein